MEGKLIWEQGNNQPENLRNFTAIAQWWSSLANQEVTFAQRVISQTTEVDELDWEVQRFDEVFQLQNPEIRGITLYWRKPDVPQERSTTPRRLLLAPRQQQLYIFPQSQPQLVIRVGLRGITYETIAIANPQWQYGSVGNNHILTLRDPQQKLEVKLTLSPDNLSQLKEQLP